MTLTYAPEKLPLGATLVPKHTQDWLKRLRRAVGTQRLRYFLVGEYGDQSERPHYHVALFGLGISSAKLIEETWSQGFVVVGTLTRASADYVAGYVTKKMTGKNDGRLRGRYPEFARMSLRPGIGANAMAPIVRACGPESVRTALGGDVPRVLRHGKSVLPLGRYLRSRLRSSMYDDAEAVKESALQSWSKEMLDMWKVEVYRSENASKSLSEIRAALDAQRVLNLEARSAIKSVRRL